MCKKILILMLMLTATVFITGCRNEEVKMIEFITSSSDSAIVCADNMTDTVSSAASKLRAAVADTTGIEVPRATDWNDETVSPERIEILVGPTNRAESASALEGLGDNDYAIRLSGSRLVITGGSDAAVARAVNRLTTEILGWYSSDFHKSDNALRLPADLDIICRDYGTAPDPRDHTQTLIYVCDVYDFGAQGNPSKDDTRAFQKALDYARSLGGGTVYVPEGHYNISGTLAVGRSVYLAGAYIDPDTDTETALSASTVLYAGSCRGDVDATPFITVGASAGIMGLSVYYPEQDIASPAVYPPSVLILDSFAGDGTQHAASVQSVTLVNPYIGIAADRGNQLHYITDVSMSPLSVGLSVNRCYDCGRVNRVSIAPRYWERFCGLTGEPVAAAMLENTVGVVLMRTDWQMVHDLEIDSCATAIISRQNPLSDEETAGGGVLTAVKVTGCRIGARLEYNSFRFAESSFDCIDNCVVMTDTAVADFAFYSTSFSSGAENFVIEPDSNGIVSMTGCSFNKWGGDAAIKASSGGVQVLASEFSGSGKAVASSNTSVTVRCNVYADSVTSISDSGASKELVIADTSSIAEPVDLPSFPLPSLTPPSVTYSHIEYVTAHGAKGDGVTDDTAAFAEAISAAKAAGGGIVWVPAGYYNIPGNLTVPTGVELRGIHESYHVTTGEGSVLYITDSKGDEDGTPFITLESGAGLRGLTFWYPEQAYNDITPYPWAVRVTGQDAYIRNICVGNCYKAIDLASHDCGGHFVENITGCVLSRGIELDGSTKAGVLSNLHFNLTFYTAVWGTKLTDASGSFGSSDMFVTLLNYLNNNLNAFTFGTTVDETVFCIFNYRARVGLTLTGGFDGLFCGSGVDGSITGLSVTGEYAKPIDFLAFADDIVPGSNELGNVGIRIDTDSHSLVRMALSGASSYGNVPPQLVRLINGNLRLYGFTANVSPMRPSGALLIENGSAAIYGITFRHVGTLNSDGTFKRQTERDRVQDIVLGEGARIDMYGCTAEGFFVHDTDAGTTGVFEYTIKEN